MVLIGLVLLAAAAAFGIDIAAQNRFDIDVEVFGQTFASTPAAVFVAGAVTGMAAALAVFLLRDGMGRTRRRRATVRETTAERDRLAAAYAAEHSEERADGRDRESIDVRDRDRDREHVSSF